MISKLLKHGVGKSCHFVHPVLSQPHSLQQTRFHLQIKSCVETKAHRMDSQAVIIVLILVIESAPRHVLLTQAKQLEVLIRLTTDI